MNAELHLLTHKNYKLGSLEGVIYKLTFSHNRRGRFDYLSFVEDTKGLHKDIVHILMSQPAVTIPAIHGVEATAKLLGNFLRVALESHSSHSVRQLDRERLNWPEYILWPDHMLAFFDKDMQESVLDLTKS